MKRQARTRSILAVIAILVGAGFSFSSLADDSNYGTATTPGPKIKRSPPRGDPYSPQIVENEIVVIIRPGSFSQGQDLLKKKSQLENVGSRLAKDLSKAFHTQDNSVKVIALYPALDILNLRLPPNISMQSAIDYLKRDGQVESVSFNYKGTLHGHNTAPPNDFYWVNDWCAVTPCPPPSRFAAYTGLAYLWGLDKIGMKQAWSLVPEWGYLPNELRPIVAVIDTGIDYDHRELHGQMWWNHGEIPNDNIDNDRNGFIDDFYGVNIIYEYSTAAADGCQGTQQKNPMDFDGHGTAVAGTIAATGKNNDASDYRTSTIGVTQHARLMAVKITCMHLNDASEKPNLTDAVAGIDYAVRMGASVIIGPWDFQAPNNNPIVAKLRTAIQNGENTVLYVASAGNNDRDIDYCSVPMWPQTFGLQNLIVVAATGPSDERWASTTTHASCDPSYEGSNYGVNSVDIGAPGAFGTTFTVQNAADTDMVALYGGTSAAAPHVAGCAALLRSIRSMTSKDLKEHLIKTAAQKSLPIKPFAGSTRRLDCGNAVSKLVLPDVTPPATPRGLDFR